METNPNRLMLSPSTALLRASTGVVPVWVTWIALDWLASGESPVAVRILPILALSLCVVALVVRQCVYIELDENELIERRIFRQLRTFDRRTVTNAQIRRRGALLFVEVEFVRGTAEPLIPLTLWFEHARARAVLAAVRTWVRDFESC